MAIVENSHQISVGDGINVIPFEAEAAEAIRHGMRLSYIPSSGVLTITIRFCSVHQVEVIQQYLSMRGVNIDGIDDDDADVYPLHKDTLIEGVNIASIDLITGTIILQDSRIISIDQAKNYLRNLVS